MTARTWIRKLFGCRQPGRLRSQPGRRFRPALETLEDRLTPSGTVYTVTTLGDSSADPHTATSGDLRYCLSHATSGSDRIQFASTLTSGGPATITLNSALPNIASNVTLDGPGANLLAVSGDPASDYFDILQVKSGFSASISGLNISNGGPIGGLHQGRGIVNHGTLTLTNCTLEGNTIGEDDGGGILNDGTATLTNCTLYGNSAGTGGAINNSGTMTLTNCTLDSNDAYLGGGGIFNSGPLTLINCTLDGNASEIPGGAGGILDSGEPGFFPPAASDTLTLINTIVAKSFGRDLGGTAASYHGGHDLIGDGSHSTDFSHVLTGDPMLGPLASNGGPTQTMALLPGSPAIGAGDIGALAAIDAAEGVPGNATDQRGLDRSFNGAIDLGAFEDQMTVTPPAAGPSAPWDVATPIALGSFRDNDPNVGTDSVTVNWGDGSNNSTSTINSSTVPSSLGNQTHTYAAAGPYTVTVTVSDSDGNTNQATFTVNVNRQTPSFSGLAAQSIIYGTASVQLSGTLAGVDPVPQGETVTISAGSASTTATVGSNGTFSASLPTSGLDVSDYPIVYSYAGDSNFTSAGNQQTTLTVNPKALTITAADESKVYGSTFRPDGTSQFTASGLVNGNSVSSVTLTSDGYAATATYTAPGPNYTITASAATGSGLGNYAITYDPGTLTVAPAALTITANNASKVYGTTFTPDGTSQFSASGLVNGDSVSSVTLTSAGYAPTATHTAPGPNYAITASAATGTGLGNYAITYDPGTLTVNPRTLTITASDQHKIYGDTLDLGSTAFTTGAGQLVNGDSVNSVTLSSPDGTTATATASHSPYQITPSAAQGSGLANYAITYDPGNLFVSPKALTVTANDATMIQGEAFPAFSVSYQGFVPGDNASVLSGTLKFSTTAPNNSTPGSYAITPSNVTSGNYTITFLPGTLTVLSYVQATINLQAQVDAAGLALGPSFDALLETTLAAFSVGATAAGANQLDGFINHVRAQGGSSIDPALADALIAAAQRIINAVG